MEGPVLVVPLFFDVQHAKSCVMTRFTTILILCLVSGFQALTQDCGSPTLLCAETSNPDSLTNAAPVAFSCMDALYTNYYSFSTNTNANNTGNVTLSVSGIDCMTSGGNDTIQAIIVEVPAGGDPCQPISYVQVSDCLSDTLDFSLESDDLSANTDYIVILGTNHDPANGPCDFNVSIDGPAVDINACCDQEISLGQSATINASGAEAIPGYSWSPALTLDTAIGNEVVAIPNETTEYTLTGFVGDCEVTDIVTIIVGPPVGIPNTITPNGDEINDRWKISGISDFPNAQITVFDRWGQVVFKDIGYAEPWDGTNRGKKLPTATYYYVIELNSTDIQIDPITGAITLVH